MQLTNIVSLVNANLAGELLTLNQMTPFLDQAIDELNDKLNTTFPAFSEFDPNIHPDYPNYNFIPDQYIRTVLCLGAAYYFYVVDEEGAMSAPVYEQMFRTALFKAERDLLPLLDETWKKAVDAGSLNTPTWMWGSWESSDEGINPLVQYVEGPRGITGPTGPTGPTGVSITKLEDDGDTFDVFLSDDTIKTFNKPAGIKGDKGDKGDVGFKGEVGPMGPVGPKGDVGSQGPEGPVGPKGETGPKGDKGEIGASAYQSWLNLGYTGTEEDFVLWQYRIAKAQADSAKASAAKALVSETNAKASETNAALAASTAIEKATIVSEQTAITIQYSNDVTVLQKAPTLETMNSALVLQQPTLALI